MSEGKKPQNINELRAAIAILRDQERQCATTYESLGLEMKSVMGRSFAVACDYILELAEEVKQ